MLATSATESASTRLVFMFFQHFSDEPAVSNALAETLRFFQQCNNIG